MRRIVGAMVLLGASCGPFDYGPRAFTCDVSRPSCPEGYGCVDGECVRGASSDEVTGREPDAGSVHAARDGGAPPPSNGPGAAGSGGVAGRPDAGGVADGAGGSGGPPPDAPAAGGGGGAGTSGGGAAGGPPPPRMCASDQECGVPFECCAPGLLPGTPGTCTPLLPLGILLCPSQSGAGGSGP